LSHSDSRVRAWSAYALRSLPLVEYGDLAETLGQLLSDDNWLVRLFSMQTLEPMADMSDYLSWTIAVDQNEIVKRQAQLYMQQPWEIIEMPVEVPPAEPVEQPGEEQSAREQLILEEDTNF